MEMLRSLMFTPGQRRSMVEKSLNLGAASPDAIMFDLEDSVPPAEKDTAREIVAEVLHRASDHVATFPVLIVRVNASTSSRQIADMRAVVGPRLTAILLPKVDRPHEVLAAAQLLDEIEPAAGIARGAVGLIAAIESALAVHNVVDIALSSPRLRGLMFGAEDYAKDIGLPVVRTGAAWDLVFARSAIVNAAAIAGISAIDQVFMDFRDQEGERRDAIASRQLGFSGKCAIHPGQVSTLNEAFSPTAAEVAHARDVVAAFNEARSAGIGCVMMGGQVVEQPILDRAERVLRATETVASRQHPA